MIWFRSANSHTGPQLHRCIRGRTDGSIRLRANLLKNRLRLAGRPQMSTRPNCAAAQEAPLKLFDAAHRGPKITALPRASGALHTELQN